MTDTQKIKLIDDLISAIAANSEAPIAPKFIGTTVKSFGLKGFKTAETGTAVFEYNDRYQIMLESLDGKTSLFIPFYKGDLSVNFSEQLNSK